MARVTEEPKALDNKVTVDVSGADTSGDDERQDKTHRNLKARHIELISIGGSIGTTLFVQIGSGLTKGGPASLFLAFTIWTTVVLAVNNCLSEMVTWIPISASFVRFADHFVDPALGFASGVNYFVLQAASVPFEITAFNIVLNFWTDKIPVAAVVLIMLVSYGILNCFAVRYYGESEFWLALGKVILIVGLMTFTLVTMVGGNPLHDIYGFRYWDSSKVQGAPFAEYIKEGKVGQFMGFLACLIQAAFTVGGPEYVSLTAGEAEMPRRTMPRAFRSVFHRLTVFFIFGSLCVGVVVPYSDPNLLRAISSARPGAGSSPYVIAMERMNIRVLPHIVNATLYGLALEGKMPRPLLACTRTGIPIICAGLTFGISCLAFLQISHGSSVVFQWLAHLLTASHLINYATISFTYIRFYKALKCQGISRDSLPCKTFWQPFCGYYALSGTSIMAFVAGYTVFLPGYWNTLTFVFSYAMIGIVPLTLIFWKIFHGTQLRKLKDITFFDSERREVDEQERLMSDSL